MQGHSRFLPLEHFSQLIALASNAVVDKYGGRNCFNHSTQPSLSSWGLFSFEQLATRNDSLRSKNYNHHQHANNNLKSAIRTPQTILRSMSTITPTLNHPYTSDTSSWSSVIHSSPSGWNLGMAERRLLCCFGEISIGGVRRFSGTDSRYEQKHNPVMPNIWFASQQLSWSPWCLARLDLV